MTFLPQISTMLQTEMYRIIHSVKLYGYNQFFLPAQFGEKAMLRCCLYVSIDEKDGRAVLSFTDTT